jgi:hypothetical protein
MEKGFETPFSEAQPSCLMLPSKPTPAQKLRIASALYATAKKVKLAALRSLHPDWPEQRVIAETDRRFLLLRD